MDLNVIVTLCNKGDDEEFQIFGKIFINGITRVERHLG